VRDVKIQLEEGVLPALRVCVCVCERQEQYLRTAATASDKTKHRVDLQLAADQQYMPLGAGE